MLTKLTKKKIKKLLKKIELILKYFCDVYLLPASNSYKFLIV